MTERQFLRHAVATLSYRAAKALRGAPEDFGNLIVAAGSRTPVQVLAHMGDLFDWALTMVQGQQKWHDSQPLPWPDEVARFVSALKRFDDYLASDHPLAWPSDSLLQGPIADALTHTGQLTMLRRIAGTPVKGENYSKANIQIGAIGLDQPAPRLEFD